MRKEDRNDPPILEELEYTVNRHVNEGAHGCPKKLITVVQDGYRMVS